MRYALAGRNTPDRSDAVVERDALSWRIESGGLTVPLNKEDKQAVVAEVAAQVAKAQTMVLAEYRGIAVGDLTQLRAKAREQQVYLRVLKKHVGASRRGRYAVRSAGRADDRSSDLRHL